MKKLYVENWNDTKNTINQHNSNIIVMKLYDVIAWAYYMTNFEMKQYSKHCILNISHKRAIEYITKISNLIKGTPKTLIVYLPTPSAGGKVTHTEIPNLCKKLGFKCIGAYSGENLLVTKYNNIDLIVGISPQIANKCKNIYPNNKIAYLPESVDTNFFQYKKRDNTKFDSGYVGSMFPVKRVNLLMELKAKSGKHNIKIKANHGGKYFNESRIMDNHPLQESKDFYYSLNTYCQVSSSEAQSRAIMEAMSTGLPCVVSNVGSNNMMIPQHWLIPNIHNTCQFKSVIDKRLTLLKNNVTLREEVGFSNRLHCEKYFSWESNIKLWDFAFELLLENKTKEIKDLGEYYINTVTKENIKRIAK